jgi:phenylpropionate dioxygenase-like ring-hydroxylating dioxygenase large terminal subunit
MTRPKIDYRILIKRDRIHTSLYTDPDILTDEFDRIFHRGWVYVGHAGEIPHSGDFRLKKIGRQPIIMARDENGQVRLLFNRCRHRGSTVCQLEAGNAKTFRCAYHGWTYRNNGELAGVPYQEGYGGSLRKEEFGLVPVPRMELYRGFIFGSLSPAGIILDDHLGDPAKEQIDLFVDLSPENEIQVRAGVHKFDYAANWKFQLENAMDGYHPNFTHQTFLDMIQEQTGVRPDVFNGNSAGESRDLGNGHVMLDYRRYNREYAERIRSVLPTTPADDAYRARMISRYGAARTAEILNAGGTHALIFPNLILIGVQIRVPQPVTVDHTEVTLYPTTLKGVSAELNNVRLRGHEAFFGPAGMGQPDDVEMFARMQQGIQADAEPWVLISRGMHRERRDDDGTLVGHATDEVTLRGIWSHYLKVMSANTAASGISTARARRNSEIVSKRSAARPSH